MTLKAAVEAVKARLPDPLGYRVWALGIMLMGLVAIAVGDFNPGQPAPTWLPYRTLLAYAASAFMVIAAAGVQWRRTAVWSIAALSAYYIVFVVILMDGRSILRHSGELLAYTSASIQVAIAAAGVIALAARMQLDPGPAAWLIRIGRLTFGVCAILFGVAHFAFMNLTAPLIPKWLPPSQEFWGYATGVFHVLGGLAILSGVKDRLAAILLAVMYASWTPLVHLQMLFAKPHDHFVWAENAVNIALVGCAWVVADSLRRPAARSA
jgi:uncharacterized membrane protein YphA (DoxX/SURF4 family)